MIKCSLFASSLLLLPIGLVNFLKAVYNILVIYQQVKIANDLSPGFVVAFESLQPLNR